MTQKKPTGVYAIGNASVVTVRLPPADLAALTASAAAARISKGDSARRLIQEGLLFDRVQGCIDQMEALAAKLDERLASLAAVEKRLNQTFPVDMAAQMYFIEAMVRGLASGVNQQIVYTAQDEAKVSIEKWRKHHNV